MLLVIIALVGLRILIKAAVLAWRKLIAPSLGFGIDLRTQGRWAVVTGATDGLGKAFAKALAQKGLDIVLVSRSMSKLKDVAAEIKQDYRVETRVVEADLTEGQVVYAEIAKATKDLEVIKKNRLCLSRLVLCRLLFLCVINTVRLLSNRYYSTLSYLSHVL